MEKTEQQIEKERAAVAAMANAKSNMSATLARIETLEYALKKARRDIGVLKGYIGDQVFVYSSGSSTKSCRSVADEAMAEITKVIGA